MANNKKRMAGMNNEDEQPAKDEADEPRSSGNAQLNFAEIKGHALKVITDPVGFYQAMPRGSGLIEPLIFMVVMAVVAGVLSAVFSLVGLGVANVIAGGLIAIVMIPIFVVIFGFIGAGIAYAIWKGMGSQEDFETAFRCVAYTAAIAPINVVLGIFPYIGSLISALWPMALLAIASIHVHRREQQTAWAVFGIIGVLLALSNVNNERTSRQMLSGLEELQEMLERQ
jgi:hypothetical protein